MSILFLVLTWLIADLGSITFLSLEGNVLPVALVIARIILNVIVRQMPLNVR
jgi:hypothetical protein